MIGFAILLSTPGHGFTAGVAMEGLSRERRAGN